MAVTRTSTGAFVGNTTAITPLFGAGAAVGDLGVLLVETAAEAPPTPSGWSAGQGFSTVGSAGVAGGTRFTPMYKVGINSTDISGGIVLGDSGDHQIAALLTYSGYDQNNPIGSSGGFATTPATTSVSMSPYVDNINIGDILLAGIATDRDSATVSTNSAASWSATGTNNGFVLNGSTSSGAGGGVIAHELAVTAQTSSATFSCTITSSIWAGMILLIKAPRPPFFNRQARLGYMML